MSRKLEQIKNFYFDILETNKKACKRPKKTAGKIFGSIFSWVK